MDTVDNMLNISKTILELDKFQFTFTAVRKKTIIPLL